MKCKLCNSNHNRIIHKGCRDNPDILVLKCEKCGLVFLDSQEQATEELYESFGGAVVENYDYEAWKKRTWADDERRANRMNQMLSSFENVDILDFGCGNGGFLRELKRQSSQKYHCCGVEFKKIARDYMNQEGIPCHRLLSDYKQQFDVITMFHVIEHLAEPVEMLQEMKPYLKDKGMIIIETPNADDVLLSRYQCEAFADYTYWSEHLYTYTSETLAQTVEKAGYEIVDNTQLQRYPFTNHMYWLSKGKPGGHTVLAEYAQAEMEELYEETLREKGLCDTLYLVAGKGE
jgi:2-polyprenyl-3-methyl-5-hydroxy-6-metoxy-1,4-benzoquinol methylase